MTQISYCSEKPYRIAWNAANGSTHERLASWQAWKECDERQSRNLPPVLDDKHGGRYFAFRADAIVWFAPAERLPL